MKKTKKVLYVALHGDNLSDTNYFRYHGETLKELREKYSDRDLLYSCYFEITGAFILDNKLYKAYLDSDCTDHDLTFYPILKIYALKHLGRYPKNQG